MEDQTQGAMAIAALFAALIEALDERSPGLSSAFSRRLETAEARLQESGGNVSALTTLAWTRTLLADELDRAAPACVVYAKTRTKTWSVEDDALPSSEKVQLPTLEEAVSFWERLPAYDQSTASVETATGHRFDATAVAALARRYRARPA